MSRAIFIVVLGCAACIFRPVMAQDSSPTTPSRASSKQQQTSTNDQARGEKVFQQNCSRCHNAPQGFSPHISATIARHMRVRASLSAADERELLKFLNP